MKEFKFYLLTIFAALIILTSCEDDFPIDNFVAGDGEARVTATVQFQPLMAALDDGSRGAAAGNAISSISNMAVVVYNKDNEYVNHYNLTSADFTRLEDNSSHPDDWAENDVAAEAATARYSLTLPEPLKFGKYHMYVAANVGPLTKEQVFTPDLLRSIQAEWKNGNDKVAQNNQMFGYFVEGENGNSAPRPPVSDPTPDIPVADRYPVYEAPMVMVNSAQTNLHAWVRRLTSKVTICFNGSKLKNQVFIYIHKVSIKQIAPKAQLGYTNPLSGTTVADTLNYIQDGGTIYYTKNDGATTENKYPDEKQYLNWLEVNKGNGISGAVSKDGDKVITHSEKDLALFFYENMQGDYPNQKEYDKKQDPKSVGTFSRPGVPDHKDNVPCGTYVEVEGYYINNNPSEMSNGKIKYRFMLGQDINYNYNCERNQHYKLTMNFVGSANQVDWHIEYVEEDPVSFAPPQFFVPYLYNQRVEMPVRLVGNPVRVTVQIVENNWAPYDSTKTDSVPVAESTGMLGNGIHRFAWNKRVYENRDMLNWTEPTPPTSMGLTNYYYGLRAGENFGLYSTDNVAKFKENAGDPALPAEVTDDRIYKNNPYFPGGRKVTPIWAGFLALQAPTGYTGVNDVLPAGIINTPGSGKDFYSNTTTVANMKAYFLGTGGSAETSNNIPQHMVVYGDGKNTVNEVYDAGTKNECKITRNKDGSRTIYIPFFTRPKAIGYISGFTGNNPYEAFPRKATLRVTSEYLTANGVRKVVVNEIRVIQERRIVNPKAIWRSAEKTDAFHVVLRLQADIESDKFAPVVSKGEWEAYITAGNGSDEPASNSFFKVSGGQWQRGNKVGGETGSVIDFKVEFPGTVSKDNPQFAKLMVKYHGGSCSHLIFLRRGVEKPVAVINDGAEWSSYSVYSLNKNDNNAVTGTLTDSPMAMGSFFRLGNYNQGILASNNIDYGVLVPIDGKMLSLTSGSATWNNCKGTTWTKGNDKIPWSDFTIDGTKYSVPTYDDYNAFVKTENKCYMGYGVLYGDESTEVADNEFEAFRFGHKEGTKVGRGMRGVVVYNFNDNRNIFFPVGAFAVGRRTNNNVGTSTNKGYLRYGAVPNTLEADWSTTNNNQKAYNQYRPICYNLPASPGALYWIKTQTDEIVSWDMNYFDMSFNGQDYGATNQDGGDAMPMKPILAK